MSWQDELNPDFSEEQISHNQEDHLYSLLRKSTMDSDQRQILEWEIEHGITVARYYEIKTLLEDNQRDPIASGDPYNQGDILKKMDKHI